MGCRPSFVAVHFGAGYHSIEKEELYKALMNKCCTETTHLLDESDDLIEAVVFGIKILEVQGF